MDDPHLLYVITYVEHIHYEDFEDDLYHAAVCRSAQVQPLTKSLESEGHKIINVHKFRENAD